MLAHRYQNHYAGKSQGERSQPEQAHAEKRQAEKETVEKASEAELPPPPPQAQSMIPVLLTVALLLGIAATAVAIYDVYGMLTMWPPEVRTDLRGALKARTKGDLELSERFLRRAYETSKMLPRESFKEEPYLKISGIAILLATVLEASGKNIQAYDVYLDALKLLQDADKEGKLSGREKLRAVSISYKLAEMAAAMSMPEDEEKHLVWAVEAILKNVMRLGEKLERPEQAAKIESALPPDSDTGVMITELALPKWATKTDVAAPLEALGTFYAKAGRLDYAVPLYLQAISVLIPPEPEKASDEDRCRGAQVMSNLANVILRSHGPQPSEEVLHQAEAWANKALEIAKQAKESSTTPDPTCEEAFAVGLFNVATMRQMRGDKDQAKKLYEESLKQSEAIKLQPGVEHARDALRQMTADANPPPPAVPTG
ncbi:putative tpr domain-containing protein [Lyophyllum shimeji]|uniref:Tpr domain-containing protein n=1 Tax=Lyophyllum shimeji TaxID=47721 RepID=A0A9P3PSM8_LYOSH|nr:putative tpr domain-containing protein [Lyophyllum shimeji]